MVNKGSVEATTEAILVEYLGHVWDCGPQVVRLHLHGLNFDKLDNHS
jgi:hypothetical protein